MRILKYLFMVFLGFVVGYFSCFYIGGVADEEVNSNVIKAKSIVFALKSIDARDAQNHHLEARYLILARGFSPDDYLFCEMLGDAYVSMGLFDDAVSIFNEFLVIVEKEGSMNIYKSIKRKIDSIEKRK